MCERKCPRCESVEHIEMYGITGLYIACDGCGVVLAHRRDEEAAHIDHPDPEQWAREGSFVLPGAEAKDPRDDVIFRVPATGGQ